MAKKKLVKYVPENYEKFFEQFTALTNAHQYKFVIEKLEETTEERRNYEFYYCLAHAYANFAVLGEGGYSGLEYKYSEEKVAILKKALEILLSIEDKGKDDARWYMKMAFVYQYLKMEESAIPYIKKWAELDPSNELPNRILQACQQASQDCDYALKKQEKKLKVKELPKSYKPNSNRHLEDLDINTFWEKENDVHHEKITDELIQFIESELGYKLPEAYLWLMKQHNGGRPIKNCYPTKQKNSWAKDHIMIDTIFSVGKSEQYSLCGELGDKHWKNEWGYPDIGIVICDTPTSGHQLIFLDYMKSGKTGEPRVSLIDETDNYSITVLANNFEEFICSLVDESEFE